MSTVTFGAGRVWRLRARVYAHEPVVLLDESFTTADEPATFHLLLSEGFEPDSLLYRTGKGQIGRNLSGAIEPGLVATLEPWLYWWENERQGQAFALVRSDRNDLLMLGACMAGQWVDPAMPAERRTRPRAQLNLDGQGLHLDLPMEDGRRVWMLAALPAGPSLDVVRDPERAFQTPPYHQCLIKHGQFPLALVQEYVLDWDSAAQRHPHLLVTRGDCDALRARTADPAPYANAIPRYLKDPNPLGQFSMEGPITAYFVTRDATLSRFLVENALRCVQESVDEFFLQPTVPFGAAPHHMQRLSAALLLADAILDAETITADERRRLLAQAAFLGYTVARPEYWSPERGFAANPNMTTSARGYLSTVACFLPTHPLAREWIDTGIAEMRRQLHTWSDANGGWLEAPHYAMVSFDQILGVFVMARNAGFGDELFDPKFQAIAGWFGKISTPPDSRFGGFRHLPPLGNTYMIEPTGEFGLLAWLWRERDAEFSAVMQWLHQQHRSFSQPGIGGGYPAFAGYRGILADPALPAKAPAWGSELFPETGVILRDAFPSDRETWLHMILGRNHDHYDCDSGSITLYGKGRILADDFGYYGRAPADDHSLVETEAAPNCNTMRVEHFAAAPRFDYVAGTLGQWTRQIAFVKSADAAGPAYFVLRDTLPPGTPATWRLWLTAARVTPEGSRARVEGKEDVDLDIIFVRPAAPALTTEDKTRTAGCGIAPDGRVGPTPTTQTGLIARPEGGTDGFLTVLYPRLKTGTPPEVVALADGQALRITTPAGTDYVFLGREPFEFKEGDMAFHGVAGCVQKRTDEAPVLAVGDGRLSVGERTVEAPPPAVREP
ncbi:MAG: hypothetical protein BWZ02_03170 [Lentisphaerae bacterium ADurb.BinA184]|nr:MAG: hypothetical protein BWZ02_03170 [Lentisphaerae bacterium ADurb.BinA184]